MNVGMRRPGPGSITHQLGNTGQVNYPVWAHFLIGKVKTICASFLQGCCKKEISWLSRFSSRGNQEPSDRRSQMPTCLHRGCALSPQELFIPPQPFPQETSSSSFNGSLPPGVSPLSNNQCPQGGWLVKIHIPGPTHRPSESDSLGVHTEICILNKFPK